MNEEGERGGGKGENPEIEPNTGHICFQNNQQANGIEENSNQKMCKR